MNNRDNSKLIIKKKKCDKMEMHIRCRKYIGGRLTSRSSGFNKTSQQNNTNNTIVNSRSGAGSGRVPFHRRSPLPKKETWRTCVKNKNNNASRFVPFPRAERETITNKS